MWPPPGLDTRVGWLKRQPGVYGWEEVGVPAVSKATLDPTEIKYLVLISCVLVDRMLNLIRLIRSTSPYYSCEMRRFRR